MKTTTENILNRKDLLGTALIIDLKVKELYNRGIRRENDLIDYVSHELNLDKNSNVVQELIHMSWVEVNRNVYW